MTRADLLNLQVALQNQIQQLEQQTRESVQQLWQNDSELRDGNRASEFNLRAHQKVLNAMSEELRHLFAMHNEMVDFLNARLMDGERELQKAGFGGKLVMHDVELQSNDGEEKTIANRINWPHYHEEVERDLEVLAAQEAAENKARAERVASIVNAIDALRKVSTKLSLDDIASRIEKGEQILKDNDGVEFEFSADERAAVVKRFRLGPLEEETTAEEVEEEVEVAAAVADEEVEENDPDEVDAAAQELLDQTKRVAEEVGKKLRGEPFDQVVIDEAQELIDKDIAEHGDEPLTIPLAKEEDQSDTGPPPDEDEFPDGADIFGG